MAELATSIYVNEINVPRVNSWAQVLEAMTLCEIWGVGRRPAIQLLADDLRTALQGKPLEPTTMRRGCVIALQRTVSIAVAARSSPATKHEALEASAVLDHRSQLMLMRSFQE